jgi:thiol-disulfide isomerase/thioredoxin
MDHSRRRFLRAGGVVLGGAIAGCVGSIGGEDGLKLRSLDVGGSPGGEIALTRSGSVTALDFFATWCPPCKPMMKHLRTADQRFPDVHLVSITSEKDEEVVRSFWKKHDATWPVLIDEKSEATTKYGASGLPTMVVLDAEGNRTWKHNGLATAEKISKKLEAAGAERA